MPYLAYDGIKNEYGCFDRKSFRKPLNGLVVAECSLGDEFALSQYQITDELAKASGRTKGEAETDVGRGKDTATEGNFGLIRSRRRRPTSPSEKSVSRRKVAEGNGPSPSSSR